MQKQAAAEIVRLRGDAATLAGRVRQDHGVDGLAVENARLRVALERLRDCDWTITPLDRMDAVRDIARAALEGRDDRPHP